MADVVAEIGELGGPRPPALLEDARTGEADTPYGVPSPSLDGLTPDPALP